MKITFTARYYFGGGTLLQPYYLVDVTIYARFNQIHNAIIRIDDKDINKTIIRPIDLRRMTVHREFSIHANHTVITADVERNQKMHNPNSPYTPISKQKDKELLCDIYDHQLIVDAGTFDKILTAFNLIPDSVELLLFD